MDSVYYVIYLNASPRAGERKGGVLGSFGLSLDVCPVIQQDLHHLLMASSGCQDQRRKPLLVTVL